MIDHLDQCLDRSEKVGTIVIDLGKAFDCFDYNFLLAKLSAYDLDRHGVLFVESYLSNRFQRIKVGSCFSTFLRVTSEVHQG